MTDFLSDDTNEASYRRCFRDPIPEIFDAARYLDAAVSAHLAGQNGIAEELIKLADMSEIREWTESIWGSKSPYVKFREVLNSPPVLSRDQRIEVRMPTEAEKSHLHERDGYHCRFCGMPVIRKEIRVALKKLYPNALLWGRRNIEQHAAFQAMWLQYDHLLPHSRGGSNELDNIVITCAPCNFGRMDKLMEEVGIADPRDWEPVRSSWDGLERLVNFQQHR
ncbi:MAG: HNH endonuclease [Hyphomicrobiales bacterium]|nr:MAG: HNH endonuclease [Hyphomicrobiales bacterium]